ncbi:ATP-binding protein [Leptolyngbya sp. FACHB-321]|uniref:sensor histidine kinase n=1 Tax=Leptolyngbya sp. FACHB-321 TaxID=2692807 RepID=UPI00321F6759
MRIGQEAFTNAIKYARANEIRIDLVYESTLCSLRVKDNGQGFEANDTTLKQGFGLLGMTKRAKRIGGKLSIQSHLGQGTEIIVSVHREMTV